MWILRIYALQFTRQVIEGSQSAQDGIPGDQEHGDDRRQGSQQERDVYAALETLEIFDLLRGDHGQRPTGIPWWEGKRFRHGTTTMAIR